MQIIKFFTLKLWMWKFSSECCELVLLHKETAQQIWVKCRMEIAYTLKQIGYFLFQKNNGSCRIEGEAVGRCW